MRGSTRSSPIRLKHGAMRRDCPDKMSIQLLKIETVLYGLAPMAAALDGFRMVLLNHSPARRVFYFPCSKPHRAQFSKDYTVADIMLLRRKPINSLNKPNQTDWMKPACMRCSNKVMGMCGWAQAKDST